jgi:uncharacterized protein (TIGR02266 family)
MRRDRRRFGRFPCRLAIRFPSIRQLKEHYITDIGAGGIFVETLYPIEIGGQIDLDILIGEDPQPLHIRGEVVWIRNRSDARPSGMGIRFLDLHPGVRQQLERLMQGALGKPEA